LIGDLGLFRRQSQVGNFLMFLEIAPVIRFLVDCSQFGFRLLQGGSAPRVTNRAPVFAMAAVCCAMSFACFFAALGAPFRTALPERRLP
jgi:hypothetical protein